MKTMTDVITGIQACGVVAVVRAESDTEALGAR